MNVTEPGELGRPELARPPRGPPAPPHRSHTVPPHTGPTAVLSPTTIPSPTTQTPARGPLSDRPSHSGQHLLTQPASCPGESPSGGLVSLTMCIRTQHTDSSQTPAECVSATSRFRAHSVRDGAEELREETSPADGHGEADKAAVSPAPEGTRQESRGRAEQRGQRRALWPVRLTSDPQPQAWDATSPDSC